MERHRTQGRRALPSRSPQIYSPVAVKRLLVYVARYKGRFLGGGTCLMATAALVMFIPALTQRAIDAIDPRAQPAEVLPVVFSYALLIAAIAVAQACIRTLSRTLVFNAGRNVEYDLRSDLFRHLESLPQAYYQRNRTGDLMSRLVNDIGAVRLLLGPGILTFINTPVYCALAFTMMMLMDWRLTLAAMVPFPILLWVVKRYSHRMMEATFLTQERLADMSSFVQENLAGIGVVKTYVREDARTAAFGELNESFRDQSMEVAKLRGRIFPFIRIVSSAGVLVVLYYGGILVVDGSLTLGQLVAFIGYLHILAWPIMALGWMISIYQRGKAALLRLGEILDTEPLIRSPDMPVLVSKMRGEIRFENVEFAYAMPGNGHPVLSDINLHIPAGSSLGLIGPTGSGKSTMTALIARLFDVTGGRVTVDGIDVRQWAIPRLRGGIGFVPQDPFLFSSSIEENIGFARKEVPPDEMSRLVEMAGLDADLAEFPQGLDTQVGERGVALSGGQKQRLTIARAIAREPGILVLDDALSSVDAATERRILDELDSAMRGRTAIIVSHRVSAVRRADRIAVVDDGRIVESGTHEELLATAGFYAQLYRRQRLPDA